MEPKEEFLQILRQEVKRDGVEALIEWLERSDFFLAPASTRFHLSSPKGLCIHSINVYKRLVWLMEMDDHKQRCFGEHASDEEVGESVAIAALLHDLCKANFYQPDTRNVKNKETGRWETVQTYSIDEKFPMGHGEKSMFIAQNYMKLTPAEAIAIRWHMGEWDTAVKGGDRAMDKAWEKYPLGFFLHLADMLASKLDEE